jgi:hypothetical protein
MKGMDNPHPTNRGSTFYPVARGILDTNNEIVSMHREDLGYYRHLELHLQWKKWNGNHIAMP